MKPKVHPDFISVFSWCGHSAGLKHRWTRFDSWRAGQVSKGYIQQTKLTFNWWKNCNLNYYGVLAERLERIPHKNEYSGSNPLYATRMLTLSVYTDIIVRRSINSTVNTRRKNVQIVIKFSKKSFRWPNIIWWIRILYFSRQSTISSWCWTSRTRVLWKAKSSDVVAF